MMETHMFRYQDIPDPDHNSELSLPLVTVTDFKQGEAGKEVILLIAGEHARQVTLAANPHGTPCNNTQ